MRSLHVVLRCIALGADLVSRLTILIAFEHLDCIIERNIRAQSMAAVGGEAATGRAAMLRERSGLRGAGRRKKKKGRGRKKSFTCQLFHLLINF